MLTPQELYAQCCNFHIFHSKISEEFNVDLEEFDIDLCVTFLTFKLAQGQAIL